MATTRKQYQEKAYAPLGAYLANLPASTQEITLTFAQVEEIVGRRLPHSARVHRQWWENQKNGSRAYHWQGAGFKSGPVDMTNELVHFYREGLISAAERRSPLTLQEVVTAVNEEAQMHPIGGLPEWRRKHKGKGRLPKTVFYSNVPDGKKDRDYVFHVGGLGELQFNIGFETVNDIKSFRHGIAFSLQPTREFNENQIVALLKSKIERFNKYVRVYSDAFRDFEMWHWYQGRSETHSVMEVPDELLKVNYFIFIGKLQPADNINVDVIISDLDRLLPVYEYVEGEDSFPARTAAVAQKGYLGPLGKGARATQAIYERIAKTVEVELRHNKIGDALALYLEAIHGEGSTAKEFPTGNGTNIDVAVCGHDERVYYEIKTAPSAQACVRDALGQLLEYSCWPGATRADRLVVVGEAPFDEKANEYIDCLRKDFSLPIEYRRFDMNSKQLI